MEDQNMKAFELKATTQKSYYRKAFVLQDASGNVFLQSYDTIVCGIVNGEFVRYWGVYSVTTMNHINDFCKLYNVPTMNKKAWINTPVECSPVRYADHVAANMGNQNYGIPACMYY